MMNRQARSTSFLDKRSDSDPWLDQDRFQISISLGAPEANLQFIRSELTKRPAKIEDLVIKQQEIFKVSRPELIRPKLEPSTPRKCSSLSTNDGDSYHDSSELLPEPELKEDVDTESQKVTDKKRVNWSALNMYFFIFVVYNYKHVSKKESSPKSKSQKRKHRQDFKFYDELLVYMELKSSEIRELYDPWFDCREGKDEASLNPHNLKWELRNPTHDQTTDDLELQNFIKKKKEVLYTRFDKREDECLILAEQAATARELGYLSFEDPDVVQCVPPEVEDVLQRFLEHECGSRFKRHLPMLDARSIWDPEYDLRSKLSQASNILIKTYQESMKVEQLLQDLESAGFRPNGSRGLFHLKPASSARQQDGLLVVKVEDTSNPTPTPAASNEKVRCFIEDCNKIMNCSSMEMSKLEYLRKKVVDGFYALDSRQDQVDVLDSFQRFSERSIFLCQNELTLANFFVMFVRMGEITNNKHINPVLQSH